MELKTIQRLVQLMQRGDVTELEIDDPSTGFKVRLKRGVEPPAPSAAAPVVHVTHAGGLAAAGPLADRGSARRQGAGVKFCVENIDGSGTDTTPPASCSIQSMKPWA